MRERWWLVWISVIALHAVTALCGSAAHAQPSMVLEAPLVIPTAMPRGEVTQLVVAANEGELLAVWASSCCEDTVFARRLDLDGAPLDPTRDAVRIPVRVPSYYGRLALAPFGDGWALAFPDGGGHISLAPLTRDLAVGPSIVLPYSAWQPASIVGHLGSVFVAQEGSGCVSVSEIQADHAIRTYAADIGCASGPVRIWSTAATSVDPRVYVSVGSAVYEVMLGSGLLQRRHVGRTGALVTSMEDGRFITATPSSVEGGHTLRIEGLTDAPLEPFVTSVPPTPLALLPVGTRWLLAYSASDAVHAMVLDATGALVRSFRPFSSEAIGTGERAYVVSGSSVYVVTEDEDTVVPVARGSAAGGGRWAFGTTTSTGAWLAMRDASGHQVLTVDALGRPQGHGFLGLSGRVGVGVPMVSEEGIVLAVQVEDAVLFALPSVGSPMVPGPYTSSAGSTLLDATWARAQPRTLLVSAWNDVRVLESVWPSDPGRIVAPLPSGTGRRILACEEGIALYQREGDAIVGYAVSDEASVGERWPVGTSEHDVAVSRGDGDAAIAWVDRGGRLFAARLDAQCRPLGRTQLATIPSLAHLGVASRGRELVAAWIATDGGPLEAVASTPSGHSPPIRIAEQTTWATSELVLRMPGDGYLFTWTSSDLSGGVERPWLRLTHLSDAPLDGGHLDAGPLDDLDAAAPEADTAGAPDAGGPPLPVGCGCRAGRAPRVGWGMLVPLALVAIRRRGSRVSGRSAQ